MSNRAKSASRNSTEKNVGSGSKSSDFERRVAELAADIHLQMDTKMRTEKDKPSVGRKQEGGNQACAHERVQDEKNERVARVLSNEYKIYNRVKNQQQLLLLYLQHNFQLSFEEIAEVKDAATHEFGKQNYRQAMRTYQKAEDLCDSAQKMITLREQPEVGSSQGDMDMLQNVRQLQVLCWLNRSLCHFLLEEYEESFICCAHVFKDQFSDLKSKIKALLRAGHSLCTLATQDDQKKNLLQTAVLCTAIAKKTIDADPVNYFEFMEAMKPLQREFSDLQSKIETKMRCSKRAAPQQSQHPFVAAGADNCIVSLGMATPKPSAQGRGIANPDGIRSIKVRSCRGGGTREVVLVLPGNCTVFDLKKLVCQQPHFMCSDCSRVVLVFKGAIPLDGTALDDAISAQLPAECAATAVVLETACRPSLSHANLDCGSQAKMLSHALHTDAAASPLLKPPIEFTLNTSLRADDIEQLQAVAELCSMGFPRQQVEACMRAAHNDTELAANYLLSANIFHSQSTCQNTAVPAPSAAAAAGASCTESEKIAEQFVAKLCGTGLTVALAEDVIRVVRENNDLQFDSIERQVLTRLHQLQLPPAEYEQRLTMFTENLAKKRTRCLLDALNERCAAVQSHFSNQCSAETAAHFNFTSIEQVICRMRGMGISASRAKGLVEIAREHLCSQCKHHKTVFCLDLELLHWNQANMWEGLARLLKEESDGLAEMERTAAIKIDTDRTRPVLGKGSRVVVEGLVTSPQMNGRTGTICGDMSPQTARLTVEIDADGARPSVLGYFLPANLRVLKHNPAIEWLDEDGLICRKNVDFSRECAKGHALVSFCGGRNRSTHELMCRVCHVIAVSDLGAWWVCAVEGCCGGYAVCGSCALVCTTPVFAPPASDEFCMQGVGIPYLKWLRSTMHSSIVHITTSQFCQMYARPRTFRSRSSVADELAACAATAHHVGNATWFISHVWSSVFVDTLDAVLLFFEGRDDAATAKVWFDIFVQSQHAGLAGQVSRPPSCFNMYMNVFKSSIARIGSLLLVVDVWNNPTALKRAWCVLELHAIAAKKEKSGATFGVAMTREEQRRFLSGMSNDVEGAYLGMLGRVNSETSECSRPSDQESIHAAIRDTIGFGKLNRMLFEVMEGWAEGQLRARAEQKMAAGEVVEAMDCNQVLASFLKQQGKYDGAFLLEKEILDVYQQKEFNVADAEIGRAMCNLSHTCSRLKRHHEALALQEKALSLLRSVLDENNPELGNAMKLLATTYGNLGRIQESLALKEQTLEFELRVLPANHPHIGSAMANLANAYIFAGRHEDALSLHQKALEFRQGALTANHPDIGCSMLAVATQYFLVGRRQEGLDLSQKAVELLQRVLPPNHPTLKNALSGHNVMCGMQLLRDT